MDLIDQRAPQAGQRSFDPNLANHVRRKGDDDPVGGDGFAVGEGQPDGGTGEIERGEAPVEADCRRVLRRQMARDRVRAARHDVALIRIGDSRETAAVDRGQVEEELDRRGLVRLGPIFGADRRLERVARVAGRQAVAIEIVLDGERVDLGREAEPIAIETVGIGGDSSGDPAQCRREAGLADEAAGAADLELVRGSESLAVDEEDSIAAEQGEHLPVIAVDQLRALIERVIFGEDSAHRAGAAAGRAARLVERRVDPAAAQSIERRKAGEAAADDRDARALGGEGGPARQGHGADSAGQSGEDMAAGEAIAAGNRRRLAALGQIHRPSPIQRAPDAIRYPHGFAPLKSNPGLRLTRRRRGRERRLPAAPGAC